LIDFVLFDQIVFQIAQTHLELLLFYEIEIATNRTSEFVLFYEIATTRLELLLLLLFKIA